jgi:hypothetical protein
MSETQMLVVSRGDMIVTVRSEKSKSSTKSMTVKTQIKLNLQRMDVFVAPTIINIMNPTFWLMEEIEETPIP